MSFEPLIKNNCALMSCVFFFAKSNTKFWTSKVVATMSHWMKDNPV